MNPQKPWERTCDFCSRVYAMNLREIPRILVVKKTDLNDLVSKDLVASPDFCDACVSKIIRTMEAKRKLRFKYNHYNSQQVIGSFQKELEKQEKDLYRE